MPDLPQQSQNPEQGRPASPRGPQAAPPSKEPGSERGLGAIEGALVEGGEVLASDPDGVDLDAFFGTAPKRAGGAGAGAAAGSGGADSRLEPGSIRRCGFVAVVGKPNAGKSTLVNHLVGQKVTITSDKAQTTRRPVRCVLTLPWAQIVFVDTPGFQKRILNALNEKLNRNVVDSLKDVDAVVFVADPSAFDGADRLALDLLRSEALKVPVFFAANKIDKVKDKERLRRLIDEAGGEFPFAATIPVSAKHSTNLGELAAAIGRALPEGEPIFDADALTDRSTRFLCGEIAREKLFRYLGDELPYSCFVQVDDFKDQGNLARVMASVVVDKDSQKGIVIGAGGKKLKKISTEARLDMERLLGKKVFLRLFVKVKSGWADDDAFLKQLGLD